MPFFVCVCFSVDFVLDFGSRLSDDRSLVLKRRHRLLADELCAGSLRIVLQALGGGGRRIICCSLQLDLRRVSYCASDLPLWDIESLDLYYTYVVCPPPPRKAGEGAAVSPPP